MFLNLHQNLLLLPSSAPSEEPSEEPSPEPSVEPSTEPEYSIMYFPNITQLKDGNVGDGTTVIYQYPNENQPLYATGNQSVVTSGDSILINSDRYYPVVTSNDGTQVYYNGYPLYVCMYGEKLYRYYTVENETTANTVYNESSEAIQLKIVSSEPHGYGGGGLG